MTNLVECRSEHTYAQQPVAFYWLGQRLEVTQVESAWRTPEGPCFRVLTPSGDQFLLRYDELKDEWSIQPTG